MARFERAALLKKFRDMAARGEPIVGGGAGTGLSAKCEEAGGIDLIVIYNSGRYRMAGRGSLAGLMPYGDANAIVWRWPARCCRSSRKTPVLAGVNGTDPFRDMDVFLDQLKALGFAGVQNFPTVGLIDGVFRANLEETGMCYALEVDMIAKARENDLLTTPYVFSEKRGRRDGEGRRRHHRLPSGPDHRRRDRRADRAEARGLPGAHRHLGGGRAQRQSGHPRARPWRPDRRARGRRLHHEEHPQLPRLLRRLLDGAAAGRAGADGAGPQIQGDRRAITPETRREENMSGILVGELILWLIVAIIVIVVVVYIVNWLYHRSSKEVSFVRTGFLGERVVINGGAFVLPFIHDYTPVNMNVLPMGIVRARQDAVITRDRMRVDIEADFYVRVQADPRSGRRSPPRRSAGARMEPEQLHALLVRQVRLRASARSPPK